MLRFLSIQNLAVVESAGIEFDTGLNVLTGETGAGKSILVGAVGLLLGGRASPDLIRTGEEMAAVQAVFEEAGDELIVRREITSHGRSRAFVNGALVTAAALKDLATRLVELHGQHEHQALLDTESHLDLLDHFAGLDSERMTVGEAFSAMRALQRELDAAQLDDREKTARFDLITFQLGEIERAAPRADEDEGLAATRQVLAHAERLQRLCAESYASLYEDDRAVLAALTHVWRRVGELAAIEPRFAPYLDARDGIKSQLKDLADFLRSYADGIDASPSRLQQIEDRLALLERLKRKYGPALSDVLERQAELARQRQELQTSEARAEELERALAVAEDAFGKHARVLSQKRRAAAKKFERKIEQILNELAMERTRFEFRFDATDLPTSAWSERGIDGAEIFLSPNLGEDLRPLARIASGGELSRIMLALKTLAAAGSPSKTLIFDEVDAGIGGRVAEVVGRRLRDLGEAGQVLCITHLPQIAAFATTHFRIAKRIVRDRTTTNVTRLDFAGRTEELARMIGGAQVSAQVIGSARELLERGAEAGPRAAHERKPKGESERAKAKRRPHAG